MLGGNLGQLLYGDVSLMSFNQCYYIFPKNARLKDELMFLISDVCNKNNFSFQLFVSPDNINLACRSWPEY